MVTFWWLGKRTIKGRRTGRKTRQSKTGRFERIQRWSQQPLTWQAVGFQQGKPKRWDAWQRNRFIWKWILCFNLQPSISRDSILTIDDFESADNQSDKSTDKDDDSLETANEEVGRQIISKILTLSLFQRHRWRRRIGKTRKTRWGTGCVQSKSNGFARLESTRIVQILF